MNTMIIINFILILILLVSLVILFIKFRNFKKDTITELIDLDDSLNIYMTDMDQQLLDTIDIIMEPIDPVKTYKLPEKGSNFAAGYDIYWSTVNKELNDDGSVTIDSGETLIFGTNLKIMITIDNFYLDICSRSGMAINKNLIVVNAPARIDSDYRGELLVGIKNISDKSVTIEPQSRIAQCTLHREVPTAFYINTVVDDTVRGEGGLGHSGETTITQ